MQVRTPILNRPVQKVQKPSATNMFFGMQEIGNAIQELKDLKAQHEAEHKASQDQMKKEHQAKLTELDRAIAVAHHTAQVIQRGEPGKDAPPVDTNAIIEKVKSSIRVPKDGETPVINTLEIAKTAAKLVTVPKVEMPEIKQPPTLKEVIDHLKENLKVEHIPGLKKEIDSYRSQLSGKHYGENTMVRGGGDTVLAGSNITITTNSDGKKVITGSAGSGLTPLTATETPNGSTTVFTFAAATVQPSYLVLDNVWVKATSKAGTVNWTWAAGPKQATLVAQPPPNDDVWGVV